MKRVVMYLLLFSFTGLLYAGGQPITLKEISGKWKVTKFTGPNGNVIPVGESAYYIFTDKGDMIEDVDGSQMKRKYFIKDSKLMIKGPVAGLNFEWDVIAKGGGKLTLKTSNKEVIELKK